MNTASPSESMEVKNIISLDDIKFTKMDPGDLTPEQIQTLAHVASKGFGMEMDTTDIRDHIMKSDFIYVISHQENIIGFLSAKIIRHMIYNYGTVISPSYQSLGIFTTLNKKLFSGQVEIILRTQNMNIIRPLSEIGRSVFLGKAALEALKKQGITKEILEQSIGTPLSEDGIFPGAYGGYLGNSERVNYITGTDYPNFCAENGDALLVFSK